MLSTISIKHTPTRKKKVIIKKIVSRCIFFSSLFIVSLLVLLAVSYHSPTILSPIPSAFSHIFSLYTEKNPDVLLIQVKTELAKRHMLYQSITISGSDINVQLGDNTEAVLSAGKDISSQLDSLQYTIAHLTIEGKRIARVDMRFERPVVTFQ